MVIRAKFEKTDGGFVGAEVRQERPNNNKAQAQSHNTHKKDKPKQAFGEPKGKHIEVVDKVEEPKESKPKSKAGRKARATSEEVHVEYSMQDKKNLLHEGRVLEMTYKSINKSLLFELLLKIYLEGKEVYEDTAPKILAHLWNNSRILDGQKVYLDTIQETAKAVGVSYPSTQKIIKNLIDKSLLIKERNGLLFDSFLVDFLESLTVNKQVVLSFEELEEEQLESITKDSKVNEEMTN